MTQPVSRDRDIAAITAYAEASSGTPAERRCVIWTGFNRLQNPARYGISLADAFTQFMQYSAWNGDLKDRRNLGRAMKAPVSDPVMMDCAAAYDEVLAAHVVKGADPTSGSTHYHEKTMDPKPVWTEGARLTLETENFLFYAGVR